MDLLAAISNLRSPLPTACDRVHLLQSFRSSSRFPFFRSSSQRSPLPTILSTSSNHSNFPLPFHFPIFLHLFRHSKLPPISPPPPFSFFDLLPPFPAFQASPSPLLFRSSFSSPHPPPPVLSLRSSLPAQRISSSPPSAIPSILLPFTTCCDQLDVFLISSQLIRTPIVQARYFTSFGVSDGSALIHHFYSREVANPIQLTIDTGFRNAEASIEAYVSVNLSVGDRKLAT
ncbi:hypothetical protein ACLOJK_009012 [Asimina triloba]